MALSSIVPDWLAPSPSRLTAERLLPKMLVGVRVAMPITANTPRPTPPKRQRTSIWSWLIFLLIFARPLYGMLRSIVPFQISSPQLMAIVAGIIVVALASTLVLKTARRQGSDTRLPTASPQSSSDRPVMTSSRPSNIPMRANTPQPRIPAGGPRFEPVITGKVMLVGIITAGVIAVGIVFLWSLLSVAAIG